MIKYTQWKAELLRVIGATTSSNVKGLSRVFPTAGGIGDVTPSLWVGACSLFCNYSGGIFRKGEVCVLMDLISLSHLTQCIWSQCLALNQIFQISSMTRIAMTGYHHGLRKGI